MAEERCWGECGGERPAETPQGLCRQCLEKLRLSSGEKHGQNDIPTSATPPAGFVPPEPEELAEQFPQLDVLSLLGQGGMGAVYEARQKHLDRLVALKILPPHGGRLQTFSERFIREARSLASLNHPRIVSVYDFGQTQNGLYYFIMEFVDGTDLRRVIQTKELSVSEAMVIVPQICEALQYAHDEGIVHRDIKPENILLNKKGEVKIADFGLAKLLRRPASGYTLTHADQKMGTPQYMAPEQIEHPNEVDHRADIYSLGVVFYEMLTGELPLGRFAPPSQKAQVDARLDNVILRALEKEPGRRYQHVSQVKTDVETISSGGRPIPTRDQVAEVRLEAVRRRLREPSTGLKIAALMNCVTAVPILLAWMILAVISGAFSLGTLITGSIGLAFAGIGLLTLVGVRRMTRLQSYGLAVITAVIQWIPNPGFLLGSWIGVWALVVLTRDEVHRAFIEVTPPEGIKRDNAVGRLTLSVLALASSFIFLVAIVESPGRGQFPWFVILFGPPLLILDLFVLARWTGRTALEPGFLWKRVRARIENIIGTKTPAARQENADISHGTRRMAIGSFALGLLCILLASLHLTHALRLTSIFSCAFFAIFLGVAVMKQTRPYREHLVDAGLASIGIIAASISILSLF